MSTYIHAHFVPLQQTAAFYQSLLDASPHPRTQVAVLGNPDVVGQHVPLINFLRHDFWGNDLLRSGRAQGGWTHFSWRPLVVLSFRANHLMDSGRAMPFHATNLAIHAAAVVAAYAAARALLTRQGGRSTAVLAAAIFATHPVHVECVANITSRADALAALLGLCAIALHAAGASYADGVTDVDRDAQRTNGSGGSVTKPAGVRASALVASGGAAARYGAVMALVAVALTAKETALVLPALFCVREVTVATARALRRAARTRRPLVEALLAEMPWRALAAYAVGGSALWYVRMVLLTRGYDLAGFANEIHNPLAALPRWSIAALLSTAFVQAFSLSLLVAPVRLSHEHQAMVMVRESTDPRNALTLAAGLAVALLAAFAYRQAVSGLAGVRAAAGATADVVPTHAPQLAKAANGQLETTLEQKATTQEPLAKQQQKQQQRRGGEPATAIPAKPGAALKAASSKHAAAEINLHPAISGASGQRANAARSSPLSSYNAASSSIDTAATILYALAFVAVTYAPSSHLFVYVAFLVAERSLFLPSFGACLVMAECLTALYGGSGDDAPASRGPTDGKPPRIVARRLRWHAVRRPLAVVLVAALLTAYCARTVTRSRDWVDEETLLLSNLQMYPTHNGMSTYGLGAIRLYAGRIEEAERLLVEATRISSLAEPRILLSQLYWRHRGPAGIDAAIAQLEAIENTTSPRKEVLGNLGLLLYAREERAARAAAAGRAVDRAEVAPPWLLARAERLVLAAYAAHGYPVGHPSVAVLAANAGAIRIVSEPDSYGHPDLADAAFREAVALVEATGKGLPSVFRNAALHYALQGEEQSARQMLRSGTEFVAGRLAQAEVSE